MASLPEMVVRVKATLNLLPSGFRYRTNWRGRLILQVSYEHHFGPDSSGYGHSETRWRDARIEDLAPYLNLKVHQEQPA